MFNSNKSSINLVAVTFADDSQLTHIHARAFKNNNLTEIDLPDTIKNIDYGAFMGNNITKITIGDGVIMQTEVFNDDTGGAGTYILEDGKWVIQS